jgi:hypothetical protein
VGIVRFCAVAMLALGLAPSWGCGLGPRSFGPIQHSAPLVRARAIGSGDRRPDSQVVPALIGRLEDPDPVVRLAAHAELRRRTGRDFGFVPWAGAEERSGAVARWWGWLRGRGAPDRTDPSPGLPPRPRVTAPSFLSAPARAPVP